MILDLNQNLTFVNDWSVSDFVFDFVVKNKVFFS